MSNQRVGADAELDGERAYVRMLYGRLDDLRERTSEQLAEVKRHSDRSPQARMERDATIGMYGEQVAQYNAVESGLCFGRLDFHDGDRRYVGRLGILDPERDYEPLLIDWRAPAARQFYLATAASAEGVKRRRQIRTIGREVVGLDDEVLDLTAPGDAGTSGGLASEAALLSALNASRTGRMRDIVATIQGEQDRIIRSGLPGVLVVQGGPGTGKTAVALHRTAFLLYTHREQLSKSGVLVVGPNTTFLHYIEQVLPSLGETGVWLSTVGDLYPGVRARRAESAAVAEIKGRLVMADVIKAAVADRQWIPEDGWEISFERQDYLLDRATLEKARSRARKSRRPHNQARPLFEQAVIEALAGLVADRIGADPLGGANFLAEADIEDIRRELSTDEGVQEMMGRLWPMLSPEQLLEDLFESPDRIDAAAGVLTEAERAALVREAGGWTSADVPLLDEAADVLGEDDRAAKATEARKRREQIAYAQGVLDILDLADEAEEEILMAYDLIDADQLAERHVDENTMTVAEKAAADRSWTLGHVIVDEAQELSAMAWRLLMKRCPSRSMTLVGDVAQTGDLAGASSWDRILRPYVADRWRLEQLTVNYRTPAEIMAVAADVLAELDTGVEPPSSVREVGVQPWRLEVAPGTEAGRVGTLMAAELEAVEGGMVAVVVPTDRLAEIGDAVVAALPDVPVVIGESTDDERTDEARVRVLAVRHAKGLEFDGVVVVDPARIIAESPRGLNDLYVALTRATQRLGVLHAGELPAVLAQLAPVEAAVA